MTRKTLLKTITLPERNEMLTRLLKVNINDHLKEHIHPRFLKKAGAKMVVIDVVSFIQKNMYDYTRGMTFEASAKIHKLMFAFIDALILDEEDVREAKEFLSITIEE